MRNGMQRIKAKGALFLAWLIALGMLGVCQYGYQKPESVDTPPLARRLNT